MDGESNRRLIPETLVGWRKRHRAVFSSPFLGVPIICDSIPTRLHAQQRGEGTTDGGKKRGLAGLAGMPGWASIIAGLAVWLS